MAYRALHDIPYTVYRKHQRTHCYISDAVRSLANIVERFQSGVYNIGSNVVHDMKYASDLILSVFNHARFVKDALQSVLDQTFTDFELLIINDGSEDDLERIVDYFAEGPRVRLMSQQHRGLPAALNLGLQQVQGHFITWTSADNIMLPNCLERLYDALFARPEHGAVYADYNFIDENGKMTGQRRMGPYVYQDGHHFGAAFLYRRDAVRTVGYFDETLEGFEDRDYAVRIARCFPVHWVPETLYLYRRHENTLTWRLKQDRERRETVRKRFWTKWANLLVEPRKPKKARRRKRKRK